MTRSYPIHLLLRKSAFADYAAKAKKAEEQKEEEEEAFSEIPDKPADKTPQSNNGSTTVSPVDRKPLTSSTGNSSPSLLSTRKAPSSKKGIAAAKVSNDFFADWDNIEDNAPEEEEQQEEEKTKEEEKKGYSGKFAYSEEDASKKTTYGYQR